jgi:hypothetical protein
LPESAQTGGFHFPAATAGVGVMAHRLPRRASRSTGKKRRQAIAS